MKSSKKPIFSTLKLQSDNPNVCTCGRHVIARVLCGKAGYDLDDYEKLINKECENREIILEEYGFVNFDGKYYHPQCLKKHWIDKKKEKRYMG